MTHYAAASWTDGATVVGSSLLFQEVETRLVRSTNSTSSLPMNVLHDDVHKVLVCVCLSFGCSVGAASDC